MAFSAPLHESSPATASTGLQRSGQAAGDRHHADAAPKPRDAVGNQAMLRRLRAKARPAAAGPAVAPAEAPPVVDQALRAPGQPLDAAIAQRFERHFGHDFGAVRVHTDAKAAESARAVDAQAYTVGSEVVFAADQYRPDSAGGQRLIAHELAHVVQQAGARPAGRLMVGAADDAHERAAEAAATALARGAPAPGVGAGQRTVQRQQPAAPQPQPQAQQTPAQIYAQALPIVQTLDPDVYAKLGKSSLGGAPVTARDKILPANPGGPEGEITISLSVELDATLAANVDAQFDNRDKLMQATTLPNGAPKRDFFPAILINPSIPTGHGARDMAETLVHEGTHLLIYMDSLGITRSRHADKMQRYRDVAAQQGGKITQKIDFFIDLVLTKANKPNNAADRAKDAAKVVSLLTEEKYVYDQDAVTLKKLRSNRQIAADYIPIGLAEIGILQSSQPAADVAKLVTDATDFLDTLDRWVHMLPPQQTAPDILPPPLPVLPSK